jgi:hypothetical protein
MNLGLLGAFGGLGKAASDIGTFWMEEEKQRRIEENKRDYETTKTEDQREYNEGLIADQREYEKGKTADQREYEKGKTEAQRTWQSEENRKNRASTERAAALRASKKGTGGGKGSSWETMKPKERQALADKFVADFLPSETDEKPDGGYYTPGEIKQMHASKMVNFYRFMDLNPGASPAEIGQMVAKGMEPMDLNERAQVALTNPGALEGNVYTGNGQAPAQTGQPPVQPGQTPGPAAPAAPATQAAAAQTPATPATPAAAAAQTQEIPGGKPPSMIPKDRLTSARMLVDANPGNYSATEKSLLEKLEQGVSLEFLMLHAEKKGKTRKQVIDMLKKMSIPVDGMALNQPVK